MYPRSYDAMLMYAERGFRDCEKGMNLQASQASVAKMVQADYAEIEKRVVSRMTSAADLRDKLLVIVVEGDGVPECCLTTWGNARAVLQRLYHGDTFNPGKEDMQEEEARWSRFCDLDLWSLDHGGRPFGYEGPSDAPHRVRAFFVTNPDMLTMRRLP